VNPEKFVGPAAQQRMGLTTAFAVKMIGFFS
jgi:hypothetical protein